MVLSVPGGPAYLPLRAHRNRDRQAGIQGPKSPRKAAVQDRSQLSGAAPASSTDASESWSANETLEWALSEFHPKLALSCSFGNPEGLV